jgi:hypothetical protein
LCAAVYVESYRTCLASFRLDGVDKAFFCLFMEEYAETPLVNGWKTIIRLHEWMFDGYFFFQQVFFNYSLSLFGYWRFRILATA